jgi:hypothetical protein
MRRGLAIGSSGPVRYLNGQDFSVNIEFNEQNLYTRMSAQFGASRGELSTALGVVHS